MSSDEPGSTGITQRELLLEMREDIRGLKAAVDAIARDQALGVERRASHAAERRLHLRPPRRARPRPRPDPRLAEPRRRRAGPRALGARRVARLASSPSACSSSPPWPRPSTPRCPDRRTRVTDDLATYGLGALPDPPDERDYPVSALYAAEGLEPTAALPASYAAPGMPPVLDQHATPMCVAYSLERHEGVAGQARPGAPLRLRRAARSSARSAARRPGRTSGTRWTGCAPSATRSRARATRRHHRIAAYYAVPRDLAAIKAAIHDLGPIVVSTPWHQSWFRPRADGTLPAPDAVVGGHAIVAYGWDQRGLRLRNCWGSAWGIGGDCWMPEYLRPADQRRLEGRRRDRAPDPLRAHGRRHRAAEPQRPQGPDDRGGQGRLARPRARRRDPPPREVRRQVHGERRRPHRLARGQGRHPHRLGRPRLHPPGQVGGPDGGPHPRRRAHRRRRHRLGRPHHGPDRDREAARGGRAVDQRGPRAHDRLRPVGAAGRRGGRSRSACSPRPPCSPRSWPGSGSRRSPWASTTPSRARRRASR